MKMSLGKLLGGLGFALATVVGASAFGQCGVGLASQTGGTMDAVTQVNSSGLLVAKGSEVEILSLANPSVPASFSPRRRSQLPSPALKLSMTAGSPRAFALLANGDVQMLTISYSPLLTVGFPATINLDDAVDIVADGQRVYVARARPDEAPLTTSQSTIDVYDCTSGTPLLISQIVPLGPTYEFRKLAKIGNFLWSGIREVQSTIYGLDGFNVSNPAAPTRTTASLANIPFDSWGADVRAMTAIGTKLLISYSHGNDGDQMRAADVTNASQVVWHTPVELNGYSGPMSSVGNQLRISILDSGIGTWDTTNPASLVWQGAYFDSTLRVTQMVSGASTDYWAGGAKGLMTMNMTNVAAPSLRTTPIVPLPTNPIAVRQRGNTTAILDGNTNTLRLYDFTQAESLQLRGSIGLNPYADSIEIAELNSGATVLACVSSFINGSVAIYDITNPAAPVLRSTITGISPRLIATGSSRLYVFTAGSQLRIYELAVPTSPTLRSATTFAGGQGTFTCMTAWNFNSLAIGSVEYGLWLLDTTNATQPFVASVWNPVPGYNVRAIVKSPQNLYVAAVEMPSGGLRRDRIETLNVHSISAPTLQNLTYGDSSRFPLGISYITNTSGSFLVITRRGDPDLYGGDERHRGLDWYHLPGGFFFGERVPFWIETKEVPFAFPRSVPNSSGSRLLVTTGNGGLVHLAAPTQWRPYGVVDSSVATVCPGEDVVCSLAFGGVPAPTHMWYRNNVPMTDGPTPWGSVISGTSTASLLITGPRTQDAGSYTCFAINSCGTDSGWFFLSVCAGDFNCDQSVDGDDVIGFFGAWDAGLGSGDINRDGSVDGDDVIAFFEAWDDGC